MKKIDTPNADNGQFRDGDVNNQIAPTELSAGWCNAVQGELVNAIEGNGGVLDENNNQQLLEVMRKNVLYSKLPVVKFEGYSNDATAKKIKFEKLTCFWLGERIEKKDKEFDYISSTDEHAKFLVYRPWVKDFFYLAQIDFSSDDIPIVRFYNNTLAGTVASYWDYNFNLVPHYTLGKIENKNCFVWRVCINSDGELDSDGGSVFPTYNEYQGVIYVKEIINSVVDFRGISGNFLQPYKSNHVAYRSYININNSTLKNCFNLKNSSNQLKFTGDNNVFHMLDTTEIACDDWKKATIHIPRGTTYYNAVYRGTVGDPDNNIVEKLHPNVRVYSGGRLTKFLKKLKNFYIGNGYSPVINIFDEFHFPRYFIKIKGSVTVYGNGNQSFTKDVDTLVEYSINENYANDYTTTKGRNSGENIRAFFIRRIVSSTNGDLGCFLFLGKHYIDNDYSTNRFYNLTRVFNNNTTSSVTNHLRLELWTDDMGA